MNTNLRNSKIILTSLLFIALLATSCHSIVIYSRLFRVNYVGVSENKLTKYLVKNNIDTSDSYFANDSFYAKIHDQKFKSDSGVSLNEFRPIQFRVFDSSGKHVNTWANCNGPMDFFANDINDFLIKKTYPKLILNTNLSDYSLLMKGNPQIVAGNYDIIIVAYWQWFMANYSLKMLKELQALPNIKNKKVLLIKLNMDYSN